jgi:hypothetical protein
MLKDVKKVLAFQEEDPVWSLLHRDPQKVMEGSEIFHGELPLEGRYSVLHEHYVRCCKDDVINIKQ